MLGWPNGRPDRCPTGLQDTKLRPQQVGHSQRNTTIPTDKCRRDDLDSLKQQLTSLGATEVLTYDELEDKALRGRIKELTGGSVRHFTTPRCPFLTTPTAYSPAT